VKITSELTFTVSTSLTMGYNITRFVSKVDQNFTCSICASVMKDAVVTLCGHSFCHTCLSTWLAKPDTESCPICRAFTSRYEIIPNISLRSMIRTLHTWCGNKEYGCYNITTIEESDKHESTCEYRNTECGACKIELRHSELVKHCMECPAIKKISEKSKENTTIEELNHKILILEQELDKTKKELEISKGKTKELDLELHELREEATTWSMSSIPEFDPDYSYGYSPSSISQLACLISKYLLSKPPAVDRSRIFMAIKRSFTYYHNYAGYAEDVHMLLATAYASNWFPEHHRWTLERWLEQVTNERFPRSSDRLNLTTN